MHAYKGYSFNFSHSQSYMYRHDVLLFSTTHNTCIQHLYSPWRFKLLTQLNTFENGLHFIGMLNYVNASNLETYININVQHLSILMITLIKISDNFLLFKKINIHKTMGDK